MCAEAWSQIMIRVALNNCRANAHHLKQVSYYPNSVIRCYPLSIPTPGRGGFDALPPFFRFKNMFGVGE